MKSIVKNTVSLLVITATVLASLSVRGALNCGTTTTSSTSRDCASSGGEACIEENADKDLFCYSTSDTTVACVSILCTPYDYTFKRREGTCVSGNSTCVWGEWKDVTTNFDHTVATTSCDPYS